MNCAIDQLAAQVAGLELDLVAGIESRGFLFSTPLAARLGIGSMMIRKPGKLPGNLVHESYDLEYGSAELTIQADAPVAGRSVLLVDDLMATGGTMMAAKSLLRRLRGGGSCLRCDYRIGSAWWACSVRCAVNCPKGL